MLVGRERIDLDLTLMDSAQCFRWARVEDGFVGIVEGQPVHLTIQAGEICAEGCDRDTLREYLDLNRNYSALLEEYAALPVARRAIAMYPGLRVLNQDPWDTLVTFILSANNNVPRIRRLCGALAESFGTAHETPWGRISAYPSPEQLARRTETELRALGMGYRAPYLIGTARKVAEGFPLGDLRLMDYERAHRMLLQLPGVGDKVADCVLLFGCRHASAFPVDTWVEKLLRCWFGVEEKGRRELGEISRSLLGDHAGLLQQFLFHAARTGGIQVDEYERSIG